MMPRIALVATLVAASLTQLGCGVSKPSSGRYDLVISLDPALKAEPVPPSITVDVIGVSETEKDTWQARSVSQYWSNPQVRTDLRDQKRTLTFGPGRTEDQIIKASDPIYKTWSARGAQHLLLIASLPGVDDQEARRVWFDISRDRWTDGQQLKATVQRDQIRRQSAEKPAKS